MKVTLLRLVGPAKMHFVFLRSQGVPRHMR